MNFWDVKKYLIFEITLLSLVLTGSKSNHIDLLLVLKESHELLIFKLICDAFIDWDSRKYFKSIAF